MTQDRREYPARPIVGIGVALLRPGARGPEILLIRRGRAPALGQWSLPGGAQHLGESCEDAARRELLEETGLRCGALVLAGYADSIHTDDAGAVRYHYTILDFAGVYCGGTARAGDDAADFTWASEADFEALALWSEVRRIYRLAVTVLGEVVVKLG